MNPGVTTSLDRLFELRYRAQDFLFRQQQLAKTQLSGQYRSKLKGRGLDFDESRHYQPGDELRNFDWRVTARTGQAHTKVFHEEKERPVIVAVDQRLAMGFGSKARFKSVQAAELAALTIWAAKARGDRVGALLWNNTDQQIFKPGLSRAQLLQIMQALCRYNQSLALAISAQQPLNLDQSLADIFRELRRLAKPGYHIIFISDFDGFDQQCLRQLHILKRHCDVSAYQIYDDLERQLPNSGKLRFSDGWNETEISTRSSHTRDSFYKARKKFDASLLEGLNQLRIPLLQIACHQNLSSQLASAQLPSKQSPSKQSVSGPSVSGQ